MVQFSPTFLLFLSTTTCVSQKNLWVASQETERLWADSRVSEETSEETAQWASSRISEETSEETSEEIPEEESEEETPQECPRTRKRWAWSDHSCEEQDEYIGAVYRLREEGIYEDFIRVHRDVNERYHGTAEFLPWHRWFIFQFEEALRNVSNNPCITLPYWDWQDSSVFDDDTFDWFIGWDDSEDECRWETLGGRCLERNMNRRFEMWRSGQIIAMITNYEQYSDDFPGNSRRNNGFRAAMEGGPHAAPHQFLGGPMLNMISPTDPLFFVHHCNVDRIWSLWQDYHGHDEINISRYDTPIHYEGRLLDEPMRFDDHRMFRMRNGDYPAPRDVLSNDDIVNVLYKNDQLGRSLRYEPNPDWIEPASSGSDEVKCDRESRRRERGRRDLKMGNNLLDDRFAGKMRVSLVSKDFEKSEKGGDTASFFSAFSLRGSNSENHHYQPEEVEVERQPIPKDSSFSSIENCIEMNDFTDQEEREIWDRLCQEMPLTSTFAERMAFLAQEECKVHGDPFSASIEWIHAINMDNELVAFECFHLPDREI